MLLRKPAFIVLLMVAVMPAAGRAGTKHRSAAPDAPPAVIRPQYNIENLDLPSVFHMLANEAHVELELDPSVRGTVNIRLEDVDAKQAIEVIAQSENLSMEVVKGVYHVKATAQTDGSHKGGVKQPEGLEGFGQMFANAFGGLLDAVTKPEVAEKFAKYRRNYYLALIKEGFTADEAMKIVIASGDPGLGNGQGGK